MSDTFRSVFSSAAIRRGAEWLRGAGPDADVVVSSRIRLARNLRGVPFVKRASRAQREAVLAAARERIANAGVGERVLWVDIHEASAGDRTLLVERHLISKEHAKASPATGGVAGALGAAVGGIGAGGGGGSGGEEPRGVAISVPDERLSIMINEEDHLRIQVIRSGFELEGAMTQIDEIDDRLEGAGMTLPPGHPRARVPGAAGLEWAFNPRFGYLTACPTNVGTGIRVSVMLHLPALKLTGEMEKVRRATRDMSLAVRGYYGEGSEAAGEFYQISNQTTLGKNEEAILDEFAREIIPQVIEYERIARQTMLERRRRLLEDQVFRALGVLRYARLLTPEESLTLLSQVRLGILTGLIQDVDLQAVNQLILLTQPAHLQRVLGREMDQSERREARADLVRQQLSV